MAAWMDSWTDCALCIGKLKNPKFLPCHHTFCCQCLERLCDNHPGRLIPCPVCRCTFNDPGSGNCSTFPTNGYAEELLHLTEDMADDTPEVVKLKKKILQLKTKLKDAEEARKKVAEQKRHVDILLRRRVDEVDVKPGDIRKLRNQIKELNLERFITERRLEEAECVREINYELEEELMYVKSHLKRCQETNNDIAESLEKEKETCKNMESQLKEMHQMMSERLKDAQRRSEEAKIEACLKAKCAAEVLLVREKESCQNLLQQMQHNTREQLKDAERRIEDAKTEGEACLKAKNDAQALLAKEKDWYLFLEQILQQKEQEMNAQLKDAESRTEEAKIEAEACQKAKNEAEALLEQEKQSCMILQEQMHQMEQKAREQVKEAIGEYKSDL